MRIGSAAAVLAAAALLLGGVPAGAATITFSGKAHGEIIDTDFAGSGITSITTFNTPKDLGTAGAVDLGIIFDAGYVGPPATTDTDLLGPPWSGGNLAAGATVLGPMLIIAENDVGCAPGNAPGSAGDVCDDPDDEGARPAGRFEMVLSSAISAFGFDIVDVESVALENGSIEFFDGVTAGTEVFWADLVSAGTFFDPTIVFGDNSANRVGPITAASVGLTQIDKVIINMGGSGAIDNLVLPEPSLWALLATGALVALRARRRA